MPRVRLLCLLAALFALAVPAAAGAAVATKTVRYGPFTVPGMMGMDTSHMTPSHMGAMKTFATGLAERPCRNCWVVGAQAQLTDAAGADVNMASGAMLHHIVVFNHGRNDLLCRRWPERAFASGNERTPMRLPGGDGYRIDSKDQWSTLIDLMNMGMQPRTLFVDVTYRYTRTRGTRAVRPLWLDMNECGNSEYAIPAGLSDSHRDFRAPISGRLVAVAGHIHDDGVRTVLHNRSTGKTICTSTAGYGRNPAYDGHIESMTGCLDPRHGRISAGDLLRLDTIYDSPIPQPDVMGIMLGYLRPARGA